MVCSNCGNELKEGAKFCTKCGASTIKVNFKLLVIPIIITVIGIIGFLVFNSLQIQQLLLGEQLYESGSHDLTYDHWNLFSLYWKIRDCFSILLISSIILIYITQNKKQRNLFSIIPGIIPCAFMIIMHIIWLFEYFDIITLISCLLYALIIGILFVFSKQKKIGFIIGMILCIGLIIWDILPMLGIYI